MRRRWRVELAVAVVLTGLGLLAVRWVAATPALLGDGLLPPAPLASVDFLGLPGHADLITANGRTALIDGGSPAAGDPLLADLRARGIERLDDVFLTSPDDAFVGGLIAVLESLPVSRVFDGGWTSDCPLYRTFLRLSAAKGIPVEPVRQGATINLDGTVALDVLLPPGQGEPGPTAPLILRLRAGRTRVLFAAAAGPGDEEQLLRLHADSHAEVLDLPMQGAVLPSFVAAVAPRLAVTDAAVVDPRLAGSAAAVLSTRQLGTIRLETDGYGTVVRFSASRLVPAPSPVVSCGGGGAASA